MICLTAHLVQESPHGQQIRPIITGGKMCASRPRLDLGMNQPRVRPTTLRRAAGRLQNQAGADAVEPLIKRMTNTHCLSHVSIRRR